jgi:hypothetical protein
MFKQIFNEKVASQNKKRTISKDRPFIIREIDCYSMFNVTRLKVVTVKSLSCFFK